MSEVTDQERLVSSLDMAIFYLDEATSIEQKITHNKHRNSGYETLLSQLKWFRDREKAFLKRLETIGR